MRNPGGPDGGSVPRRAAKFWAPLNTWWRSFLAEKGRRPVTSDVESWYNSHAAAAWGEGRPSWKEARIHAKCLRSTEQVKNYFREYRARSKVGARAVSSTSGEGPGSAGGSADHRSLDMRRGTSLSILVPADSGRQEFASPASSSRARSTQPGSARAGAASSSAAAAAAAAAAAEPSNLGVLIAAHNARIARMGSFGGGSSASASPASHTAHAHSEFTPTSSLLDTAYSMPPDPPTHHTPPALSPDNIFSALNPSTVTTGGGLPQTWSQKSSSERFMKHEYSRFHSLHSINFGQKDTLSTLPPCDRSISFGSGSYPSSTAPLLALQQPGSSFRLDTQRSLRPDRTTTPGSHHPVGDSGMADHHVPPMRALDSVSAPVVPTFSSPTQRRSTDTQKSAAMDQQQQQQQVPGATILAWCNSATLDRSSAPHTVTTSTPRTHSLPSEYAATPIGGRGSMQSPLFDDSPFSCGGTAAFLAAAHPFPPPSSAHHARAPSDQLRPLFSDSSAARLPPAQGPPAFSTSASVGDARVPFQPAPWVGTRASVEASVACSASAQAAFVQPADRPTWAGSLHPAAPAVHGAAASDSTPDASWAAGDDGGPRRVRRASMQDHAGGAGSKPPSMRSNSLGYDQANALSLHASQLVELRSASFPSSQAPGFGPAALQLQAAAAAAGRMRSVQSVHDPQLARHRKPPVPGLPRCSSRSGTNSPEELFCRDAWGFVGDVAPAAPAPEPDASACHEQQLLADTVSAEISCLDFNDIVQQRRPEYQPPVAAPPYEQQQGYQANAQGGEQLQGYQTNAQGGEQLQGYQTSAQGGEQLQGYQTSAQGGEQMQGYQTSAQGGEQLQGYQTSAQGGEQMHGHRFGYVQQQYQPREEAAAPAEDNLPSLTFQSLRVDSMRGGVDALPQTGQQWEQDALVEAMDW